MSSPPSLYLSVPPPSVPASTAADLYCRSSAPPTRSAYYRVEATLTTTNETALQSLVEALSTSSGPPFSDLLEPTEVANAAGEKLYRCTTPWLDGLGRLTLPAPPPPPALTSSGFYLPDFVNVTNVASKALSVLLQASAATVTTAVTVAATAAVAAGAGASALGGAAGGAGPSGAVNALTQAQRLGAFGKLGGPPDDGDDGGGGGWTTGRLNFASRSDDQRRRRRLAKGGGGGGADGAGGADGGDPISDMLIVAMLDTIYSVLALFGIVVVVQYTILVYWRLFANRKYYAWKPPKGGDGALRYASEELERTIHTVHAPPFPRAGSVPITSEAAGPFQPSPPPSPPQKGGEESEAGVRKIAIERDDADADGDKKLDFAEFGALVRAREKGKHYTEEQLRSRFTALDLSGDGFVDMSEYLQFALRDALGRDAARVMELFRAWDMDKTGWLDKKEFYAAIHSLGFDATQKDSDSVFDALDDDGSGKLTFFECFGRKKKADKQRLLNEAALEAKKRVRPKFKSLPAIFVFPTLEKFMLVTFSPALITASTSIIGAEVGGAHIVGTEAVVVAALTIAVVLIWHALEIRTLIRFRRRHHDVCWQNADPPQVSLTTTAHAHTRRSYLGMVSRSYCSTRAAHKPHSPVKHALTQVCVDCACAEQCRSRCAPWPHTLPWHNHSGAPHPPALHPSSSPPSPSP